MHPTACTFGGSIRAAGRGGRNNEMERRDASGHDHDGVQKQYDETAAIFEEGMARMALYHRHCQDPVIFRTLGDIRGKPLLDLACGNGFYTRRFRRDCSAHPVMGVDLSPMLIRQAEDAEVREPLGIEYRVGDVTTLDLERSFDVVTAIHLLHYLQSEEEIEAALRRIHSVLRPKGRFVTMIANPEFDLATHDPRIPSASSATTSRTHSPATAAGYGFTQGASRTRGN
jgi:ubiquinone/menaquinone biosynthesis C-methylase UbiE